MPENTEKPCLKVCETCPWLTKNHGKDHPAGWYDMENLKRLWNGLRTGDAPGMVCHSTDPNSVDYGAKTKVKDSSVPRNCAGALLMVATHLSEVDKTHSAGDTKLVGYKAKHKLPLTRQGIRYWIGEYVFGRFNNIQYRTSDLSLPWEKDQSAT